jgi:phenylalanyl-tRNA synthetase beta chain
MKFSEQWLREWVNPAVDSETLAHQLTMAGLEVASIEPVSAQFNGVVVGQVLDVQAHPDADKLRVCQVDVGQGEPLNIVCGASNVRAGLKVPVAMLGATLGADFKIKRAKLRGIESQGMICSAQELSLSESSQGILSLAQDAPIGMDFRHYWQLDDKAITVELTPNRGDCASLLGLTREVAAINDCQRTEVKQQVVAAEHELQHTVIVEAAEACPRYVGRVITNVNNQASTPLWLNERLRRSSMRSINPVVDILNYVMLELGQPMHAFDLHKVSGDMVVRKAKNAESLTLLNGQTIELTPDSLVIADKIRPLALAGIMGGADTEVSVNTDTLLLESAYFDPIELAGKARQYGLHTDASYRYERGVDPALTERAMQRATELIVAITAGKPGPLFTQTTSAYLPKANKLTLRRTRIKALLGIAIDDVKVQAILQNLGMQVEVNDLGWEVIVPTHRFDISQEVDLIEELARIHGYDQIPATAIHAAVSASPKQAKSLPQERLQNLLVDRGFHEVITYSFVPESLNEIFAPGAVALQLSNPISAELAVMRAHLAPSLLAALQYNQHRQQDRVWLFECGLCFSQDNGQINQQNKLGGIMAGSRYPLQWGEAKAELDFFAAKAEVEALLRLTRREQEYQFVAYEKAGLHPGQTAAIVYQGQEVGYLGALHPSVVEAYGLRQPVYLFELDLATLTDLDTAVYKTLSKFPSIRRDIALLVAEDMPIEPLLASIRAKANDIIKRVELFDVYQGKGLPSGQKSIALSIVMQHDLRTLIDEEINTLLQAILTDLQQTFGAKLRDE